MSFTFAEPTEWWLETTALQRTWQQSQHHSTADRSWTAYLNQLCLTAILIQFKMAYAPAAHTLPRGTLDSIWEFVNGSWLTDKTGSPSPPTPLPERERGA